MIVEIQRLKQDLIHLKDEIKNMESRIMICSLAAYHMQNNIMDMEDANLYEKFEKKCNINKFKSAATHNFSPTRHENERCSKDNTRLAAFFSRN